MAAPSHIRRKVRTAMIPKVLIQWRALRGRRMGMPKLKSAGSGINWLEIAPGYAQGVSFRRGESRRPWEGFREGPASAGRSDRSRFGAVGPWGAPGAGDQPRGALGAQRSGRGPALSVARRHDHGRAIEPKRLPGARRGHLAPPLRTAGVGGRSASEGPGERQWNPRQ